METFNIEIKEVAIKMVEIVAHTKEEAIEEAKRRYKNEEIVLDDPSDLAYVLIGGKLMN